MFLHNLEKRQQHYDEAQASAKDDRLRRMIVSGVEIPPFLKHEVERILAEDEGRANSTHRPDD